MDFQYSEHLNFNSGVLAKVYCKCAHARTHTCTHTRMHTHTDKTGVSWTVLKLFFTEEDRKCQSLEKTGKERFNLEFATDTDTR